jgi:hypothetical protein
VAIGIDIDGEVDFGDNFDLGIGRFTTVAAEYDNEKKDGKESHGPSIASVTDAGRGKRHESYPERPRTFRPAWLGLGTFLVRSRENLVFASVGRTAPPPGRVKLPQ